MKIYQAVTLAQYFVKNHVKPGDVCIDATAGRGNDTLFLARAAGDLGKVYSFDIQREAVEFTKSILHENGIKNTEVIKDSHVNMGKYVKGGVSAIMFNLGWLPGSSHIIKTQKESTLKALEISKELIFAGGIISVVIYSGKDCGFEEKDAVLNWACELGGGFTVLKTEFLNRGNDPPVNLFIVKD